MRLLPKALMLTVAIIGVASYAVYLKTGTAVWRLWAEKTADRIVAVKDRAMQTFRLAHSAVVRDDAGEVIYKWVDAEGVLQYSNVPPSPDIVAEVVVIDPKANSVPAVVAAVSEMDNRAVAESPAADDKSVQPFSYTPERLKDPLDEALNAQQMMNQKLEHQQQVLDKL